MLIIIRHVGERELYQDHPQGRRHVRMSHKDVDFRHVPSRQLPLAKPLVIYIWFVWHAVFCSPYILLDALRGFNVEFRGTIHQSTQSNSFKVLSIR